MVIGQGDVCWASLENPVSSGAGFRRPVVIVQGDAFNASRISTTVVVPLTSNQRLAAAPGNVALPAGATGLPKDSVANVSQLVAIDRELLTERVGCLTELHLDRIMAGIDLVLASDPGPLSFDTPATRLRQSRFASRAKHDRANGLEAAASRSSGIAAWLPERRLRTGRAPSPASTWPRRSLGIASHRYRNSVPLLVVALASRYHVPGDDRRDLAAL
jgi:mRNA interferase MazF